MKSRVYFALPRGSVLTLTKMPLYKWALISKRVSTSGYCWRHYRRHRLLYVVPLVYSGIVQKISSTVLSSFIICSSWTARTVESKENEEFLLVFLWFLFMTLFKFVSYMVIYRLCNTVPYWMAPVLNFASRKLHLRLLIGLYTCAIWLQIRTQNPPFR